MVEFDFTFQFVKAKPKFEYDKFKSFLFPYLHV